MVPGEAHQKGASRLQLGEEGSLVQRGRDEDRESGCSA